MQAHAPNDSASDASDDSTNDDAAVESTKVDLSDLTAPLMIERRLRGIPPTAADLAAAVRGGTVHLGTFTLAAHDSMKGNLLVVRGNADIYGKLSGNLVTLDGTITVHHGGSVSGDVVALNGTIDNDGDIGGTLRSLGPPPSGTVDTTVHATPSALALTGQRLAGTFSTFLALLALGIAFVLLARPKLEVVADTASHAFARSLLAGFIGQVLAVPTLAILVVGLIVSVIGIVLLPFAVAAFLLLIGAGTVGGIVAVAHSLGEVYTRRQLAIGKRVSANSYRYVALGLGALAVPCFIGAAFGWVPVVGPLLRTVASLIVWLALTVGLGAMLLSRGGRQAAFTSGDVP